MKLDFIEIGTSDFGTLADGAGMGISIEPVKPYFDNLPQRKGLIKLNVAISNTNKSGLMYYCDANFIKKRSLPAWLRGCNSLDTKHPSVLKYCKRHGIEETDLIKVAEVQCITLEKLFADYNIEAIDFLKVDAEGHDYFIIHSLFKLTDMPKINKIQFESNSLMTIDQHRELVLLAEKKCYSAKVVETKKDQNTILEQNHVSTE